VDLVHWQNSEHSKKDICWLDVEYSADDSSVLSAPITELDDFGNGGHLLEVIDILSDNSTSSLNDWLSRCQTKRYPLYRAIINDDNRDHIFLIIW